MMVERRFLVALGRFSSAQSAPVVPGRLGRAGLDHDRLVGVDVGVGHVDLGLAGVGDGHAGNGDVGLAAVLDGGNQRVKILAGEPVDLEAEVLGERLGNVDVKALGVTRSLVHRLERREEEVGDAGELALVDDGVLAIRGLRRGIGRIGAGGAATGKQTCRCDGANLHELTTGEHAHVKHLPMLPASGRYGALCPAFHCRCAIRTPSRTTSP